MPRSRSAPPPSSSALRRWPGRCEILCVWSARTARTSPSAPCGDEFADADHVREVARPHRLHREQPAFGRRHRGRAAASARGERERLLDEDVLAVLEREDRVLGVQRMRGRDVDDVDVRVGDEVFVRAVRARDAELGREGSPRLGAARADGGDVEARGAKIAGEGVGDAARGEDAPAQAGRVGVRSCSEV